MKYFPVTATNAGSQKSIERTVVIQNPATLAGIETSLTSVWNHYGVNSMEGYPKYRMEVHYADGTTQTFVFTRTEWGGGGCTPRQLLKELEKDGL